MDTTSSSSPPATRTAHLASQPSLRYLVCFDIPCNRTRRKVGRALLGYGHRVQKSVFECCLTPPQHKTLQRAIDRLCTATVPNIRWYRLRPMDAKRIDVLGLAVQTDWQDFYIV